MVKGRNKYRAIKQTYNGYSYDSKKEAAYAMELDQRIKAGEVERFERQHKIELIVNGLLIGKYYIDFKVFYPDGRIEYVEVKGFETALWKLKWKIAKAIYKDYNFVLVK